MHSGGSGNTGIGSHLEVIGAAEGKTVRARSFPSASVMTGGPAGPSTQCAHDRPSLPDPVGHADHGQNAVWMGWSQPSLSEFAAAVLAQPETGPWFGEGLATRQAVDVLLDGAPGAGRLLLNTKASQEAACSRAPAAIVPGQKPESRDAGVSQFGEIGSHPEGADTAEGHAGQVERSGMSGKCRNRLTPGSDTGHRRGRGAGWRFR